MLRLSDPSTEPVRDWPVVVQIPQNGGKTTRAEFRADFIVLPTDELAEVEDDDLHRVITGWSGVAEEDGKTEIPFSADNLRRLLRIPYVRVGLLAAYRNCLAGHRAKN